MVQNSEKPEKKSSAKKVILWVSGIIISLIIIVSIFLYINFNRLLSEALMNSFNTSIASDLYELKFKNLNASLVMGNIKVKNVSIQPREKPLTEHPKVNSSIKLNTKEILLANVQIRTLLTQNILKLDKIKIESPEVEISINSLIPIFLPLKDTTQVADTTQTLEKRSIEGFFLQQFDLQNANIHTENFAKERDLQISNVNISLTDLNLDQQHEKDLFSYCKLDFYIGEIKGSLEKESMDNVSIKDYKIIIDSLKLEKTVDTLIFHFHDFNLGFTNLDVETADSIYHLTLQQFNLSYKQKSLQLKNISFKPNISEAELQKRKKFQITQFAGNAGLINITGINFDSLLYSRKLFIDSIAIDSVSANIFKDRTCPMDTNRFPQYPAQSIAGIKLPLLIKQFTANHLNLTNREHKPNSSYANANINRGKLVAKNITNINTSQPLSMNVDAWLENKVQFFLNLEFDYNHPQFRMNGAFPKFNISDLNPIIHSYTPVTLHNGIVDEIEFSGTAYKTKAEGTMKFLYHDLKIDIDIEDKAPWKSSILSFAANTIVSSSNPPNEKLPPRIVNYHIERDMNKAFINVIIKSTLNGLKETILMSKETKKLYKEEKREAKKEGKE